jgi:hypothetical protein
MGREMGREGQLREDESQVPHISADAKLTEDVVDDTFSLMLRQMILLALMPLHGRAVLLAELRPRRSMEDIMVQLSRSRIPT